MKIAILTRPETMERCTGKGCLRACFTHTDAFARYEKDVELAAFTHAGGDLERKIEMLKKNGVETVHLSSCMRSKAGDYEAIAERLAADFDVVGYTHGEEDGNTRKSIILRRKKTEE